MTDLNRLFRKRIGFPEKEKITLESLDAVLELTGAAIPFENICTISGDSSEINKNTLVDKIFTRNEGGLCYELNAILYLFLLENDLNVQLVRGAVYVPEREGFSPTGNTHVAILMPYEGKRYVVDTGFGGNLPLKPVPLDGEEVSTSNGEFRVKKEESDYGNYFLEMKVKFKDSDWRKGYAFDSLQPVGDLHELNEAKRIITEHPLSPFNKKPLLTRITAEGNMILTETSFTQWKDGQMIKEDIGSERFKELAKEHFKLSI